MSYSSGRSSAHNFKVVTHFTFVPLVWLLPELCSTQSNYYNHSRSCHQAWSLYHGTQQGRKKIEIQLPNGPMHFGFQLPPLKYYLPYLALSTTGISFRYEINPWFHVFNSLVCSSCFWVEWTLSVTRLRRLISLTHQTIKLPFPLAHYLLEVFLHVWSLCAIVDCFT